MRCCPCRHTSTFNTAALRSVAAAVTRQHSTLPPRRRVAAPFAAPQQAFAFHSLPSIMYANKTNGSYVRPPSGTRVVKGKHPSQSGDPYPVELRQIVISMWENGEDLRAPRLMQLRHQRKFPSLSTCKHWIHQYQAEGNVLPMRALGNSFSTHEVHRQDLINLVVYWMVRPKAYIDEVHAYVHNRNPANPPFSQSQIYRAEHQLGLFRKAASTTSNLAYSHVNLKCHEYWSQAFPDGVAGESMRDLIDIDGSGYRLNSQIAALGR
jgi:hypothetical protein